jgi:PAS domain S-box-containing protein
MDPAQPERAGDDLSEPFVSGRALDDYRTLADAIPQLVWSTNADGSVDYCNRAWYEYTGQTAPEVLRGDWAAAIAEEDREQTVERWGRSVSARTPFEIEYRLRRRDGMYHWFVTRAQPVADPSGEIVRWYGTCTDIDDLKTAEAALRKNAAQFRRLADSLPQIVWMTDGAGKNTFLNRRWFDYTGVDPRLPHSLEVVVHPEDYDEAWARWRVALETGSVYETEYRLKRADGVYRWFLGRAVPVRRFDESVEEWFGSCTDIEDQKRAVTEIRHAYERERRIATTLQQAYLSHRLPSVAGFRFDAVYRPAEREAEVGGDWYDAIELDDGRIAISIGDVAGHGLDAAVVMGNVRQAIRVVAQLTDHDPVMMLDAVDRNLRRESPEKIVTAFIGIIDPNARTLTFASAGHPPPLLYAEGAVSELKAHGLPLGLRDYGGGVLAGLALPASGTLLLYTDGLIESTRNVYEGERRLREALVCASGAVAPNPAQYVQERVLRDGARDDVAVLAVTIGELDELRDPTLHQQVA